MTKKKAFMCKPLAIAMLPAICLYVLSTHCLFSSFKDELERLTGHLLRACVFGCITGMWQAGKSYRIFSVGLGTTVALQGRQTCDVTLAAVELSCWEKMLGYWGSGVRDLLRYTSQESLLPS